MPIKIIKNDEIDKRQGCPKKGSLIGLDLGRKTIGVAISDEQQSIATPVFTIERTKLVSDMNILSEIVMEYEVRAFVIGWPLNMDGSEGSRCDMVRSFTHEIRQAAKNEPEIFGEESAWDPWIGLFDERLSTQAVDSFVESRVDIGKKAKRGAKESGLTDKLAAQVILQGFVDSI